MTIDGPRRRPRRLLPHIGPVRPGGTYIGLTFRDVVADWRVLAASVTRFTIGELGTRHPVAWYIDGVEQPHRTTRPGAFYPTGG